MACKDPNNLVELSGSLRYNKAHFSMEVSTQLFLCCWKPIDLILLRIPSITHTGK